MKTNLRPCASYSLANIRRMVIPNALVCILLIAISFAFFACSSGGGSGSGSTYSCQFSSTCIQVESLSDCTAAGGDPVNYCPGSGGGSSSPGGGGSSSSRNGNIGTDIYDSRDGKTYKTVIIGTQTWMAENLNYKTGDGKCYGEDGIVENVTDDGITLSNEEIEISNEEIEISNEEIQANCAKYGRLYKWSAAMALDTSCNSNFCFNDIQESKHEGICPSGWHLPTKDEWETLIDYVGGYSTAAKHLKATSDWYCRKWSSTKGQDYVTPCNGEDTYGFTALPGGDALVYEDDEYVSSFYAIGFSGGWWSTSNYSLEERETFIGKEAYRTNMAENDYLYNDYTFKNYSYSIRCIKN